MIPLENNGNKIQKLFVFSNFRDFLIKEPLRHRYHLKK
jgi:hypothetical protein